MNYEPINIFYQSWRFVWKRIYEHHVNAAGQFFILAPSGSLLSDLRGLIAAENLNDLTVVRFEEIREI
jgi:hypothetical protein